MLKFNTMTFSISKQLKLWVHSHYFFICHMHHVLCWFILPCGLSDWRLNLLRRQFKFKTSIKIWVLNSHTGPFKLDTILSLHLFSALIQNPLWTTNKCNIFYYSPLLMVPEATSQFLLPTSALSWQMQCHCDTNQDTSILKCWCFQHLRIAGSLFSWSTLSLLVCVLHIQFCDLKPVRAFAFWIYVEMY